MKLLILLALLISSSAHALFTSHEEYARYVMDAANNIFDHSELKCGDNDNSGFWTCTLYKKEDGTNNGYNNEYDFLRDRVDKMNKGIWINKGVPELYIRRDTKN
jgi:hypothetical protein